MNAAHSTPAIQMIALTDLLNRCHAALGHDRFLDGAIFAATSPRVAGAREIVIREEGVGWRPETGPYQSSMDVPRYTGSIEAVVELIKTGLPGFWWTCGFCELTNDASIYPRGTTSASLGVDHRQGDPSKLLSHPTMWRLFDRGFHCDRVGGTVALSLLSAFFQARIALLNAEQS